MVRVWVNRKFWSLASVIFEVSSRELLGFAFWEFLMSRFENFWDLMKGNLLVLVYTKFGIY